MQGIVYGLVDPRTDGVRYIGASTNLKSRMSTHHAPSGRTGDSLRARWLQELAAADLRAGVRELERFAPGPELETGEKFWIAQGRGLGWPLTNIAKGGKGPTGCFPTPEHRAKNSAGVRAHRAAHPATPEYRAKLSAALKGRAPAAAFLPKTPEWRRKLAESNRGQPRPWLLGRVKSASERAKLSAALKGKPKSPSHRAKIRAVARAIIDGAGTRYETINDAAKALGLDRRLISGVLHGRGKTCGGGHTGLGFTFRWAD